MIWYPKVEHGGGAAEERDKAPQKAAQEEDLAVLSNNCSHREAGECHAGPHKCSDKDAAYIKSGGIRER